MTNQEKREQMKKDVQELYELGGMNCAEIVLLSYLKSAEIDLDETAVRLASGFGGGFGYESENTCGALVAANIAVSCVHGRKNPLEIPLKLGRSAQLKTMSKKYKDMTADFKKEFGSTICREMCAKCASQKEIGENCKNAMFFASEKVAEILYP